MILPFSELVVVGGGLISVSKHQFVFNFFDKCANRLQYLLQYARRQHFRLDQVLPQQL